jgi:ubiquitin C
MPRMHEGMQILVKTLQGKDFILEVDPLDTIEKVKAKIEYKEGVPSVEQKLAFGGKFLGDDKALFDYNIQNGKILVSVSVYSPSVDLYRY